MDSNIAPNTSSKPDVEAITNHVSVRLPAEDLAAIQGALQTLRTKLDFLKSFTPEERESLMHLGKTGRTFIRRALDLVVKDPGVLPRSFNEEEFAADAVLYGQLGQIGDQLKALHQQVVDTEAAVGTDAFTAALVVYQCGKMAQRSEMDSGLPGMEKRLAAGSGH